MSFSCIRNTHHLLGDAHSSFPPPIRQPTKQMRSQEVQSISREITSPKGTRFRMAAVLSKGSPTREVVIRPAQTTFETSNRYVQSFLAYDLFSAIETGSVAAVRSVLLSYPDLDLNFHIKDITPLSLTLYKKHFDIFHLFMRHNERSRRMDLNMISKDHFGRVEPPIITACRLHFLEGVVALVEQGADIDCPDSQGHTALWVAARQQMPDLVEYLIANCASVNCTDRYHCTPLLAALMYRVSSMIIKMLIVHGSSLCSPHPWSSAEHCPLFWAAKHGNSEIVKLVLTAGVPMAQIRTVKAALVNSDVDISILEQLEEETRSPPSLQHQCKCVLRQSVSKLAAGKQFVKNTELLPLPLSMIQYILLNRCEDNHFVACFNSFCTVEPVSQIGLADIQLKSGSAPLGKFALLISQKHFTGFMLGGEKSPSTWYACAGLGSNVHKNQFAEKESGDCSAE